MSEEELTEGWAAVPLGQCVDILDGRRVPVNSDERAKRLGNVPYYGATGQVGWIDDHLFDEPLVLLGEDGAPFLDKDKPIAYLVAGKTWVNNHAHVLRAIDGLTTNEFIKFVLDAHDFREYVNGTTRLKLTQGSMVTIPVPLMPLVEQRRIVEKVEALLTQVNAARTRLAKVPTILKRFRQSILSAACSGRLTEDWRRDNPSQDTGQHLLDRIKDHRRGTNSSPSKRGPNPSDEALAEGDLDLPETPPNWASCRVADIATVCLGGTPSRKESAYWNGGVPWVSSGEVANCRIARTRERITEAGLSNSSAKVYPKGSVLIAMIGEGKTRGQSAILDIEAATNQNAAGLLFDAGNVDPEYVWRWALGEYARNRDEGRGGNQPALNGQKVRDLPLPLPPLAEQHEIVRRVDALFKLADAIEARLAAAIARTD